MPSQKDKEQFQELVAEYNRNPSKTSAINIFDKYLNETVTAAVRIPLNFGLYSKIRDEVQKYRRWLEERNTNFSSFFSRIARSASSTPYKARPNIFDPVLAELNGHNTTYSSLSRKIASSRSLLPYKTRPNIFDRDLGEEIDAPLIIHYIWWGPFEAPGRDIGVLFNAPNEMAQKIEKKYSIYFWCGQKFLDEHLKKCVERNPVMWSRNPPSGIPELNENILVNAIPFNTTSIEDGGDVFEDGLKRGYKYYRDDMMANPIVPNFSSLALGDTTKLDALEANSVLKQSLETLIRLDQYDARAALKDLMVLVILYLHGGLFLDTTSRLPDDEEKSRYNMLDINDCLANLECRMNPCVPSLYNIIRGVVTQEKTLDFQPGVKTTNQIVNGTDYTDNMAIKGRKSTFAPYDLSENREPWMGLELSHIEVWAAFSNRSDHSIFLAIESYVDRMARMGISKSGIPLNQNSVVTGEGTDENNFGHVLMMRPKDGIMPRDRDAFIGSVITSSYYDGFIGNGFSPDEFESEITWQAITINDRIKKCYVPSLGIVKYYGNTWRV